MAVAWGLLNLEINSARIVIPGTFTLFQISHFKIPKYVLFVDDFPKTVTGKIQKFKLREKSRELLHL